MLEVIHISDTHFGPDRNHEIRGANACRRAEALVEAINGLPFVPDFIIHTGDVVNDPDERAYRLAAEVLSGLGAPVYYATGNHDEVPMMRRALTFGPHQPLLPASSDALCYRITAPGTENYDLLVIDARVSPAEGPHGFLPQPQIDAVLAAASGTKPLVLFIHYPLSPIGSPWIDGHLLVTNGAAFLAALKDRVGDALRGIFSGHLHRGFSLFNDGVFQSGVSSPACEFSTGPHDDFCDFLPGGPIPFHHISLSPAATMVKDYSIPFSGS